MKKSEYKEAARTIVRAKRYGVGNRHPLSPDREQSNWAHGSLRKMHIMSLPRHIREYVLSMMKKRVMKAMMAKKASQL